MNVSVVGHCSVHLIVVKLCPDNLVYFAVRLSSSQYRHSNPCPYLVGTSDLSHNVYRPTRSTLDAKQDGEFCECRPRSRTFRKSQGDYSRTAKVPSGVAGTRNGLSPSLRIPSVDASPDSGQRCSSVDQEFLGHVIQYGEARSSAWCALGSALRFTFVSRSFTASSYLC